MLAAPRERIVRATRPGATARMTSERLVLFEWGVSSYYGWGVYGLNLLLNWEARGDLVAATLLPIDASQLDLDPLEMRLLTPAFRRSAEVQAGLRAVAGRSVTSLHVVLHTLHNGLVQGRAAFDAEVRGTPQVGVAFLDDTRIGRDAAHRLGEYAFVVAGSSWNRDLLREAGAPRVERVLQGVDTAHFHPAPRRAVLAGRYVVFSGGKLEFRKGQDLVLQAFGRFAERHPDAVLLTAWSSPWPGLARSLETNAAIAPPVFGADGTVDVVAWAGRNNIPPEQVIDLGPVSNRLMPRILREADIAIFPSRAEGGTNLVAMECMACGVPTVLAANTGHLDLIGGGRCIPLTRQTPLRGDAHRGWGASDVEEMVAALEAGYDDPGRARRIGQRGARFIAGMSWGNQLEELAALVRPLL